MKTVMVVPTIREDSINRFLAVWRLNPAIDKPFPWDELIVVEDNPDYSFDIPVEGASHFCWKDIEEDLGENSWIISRRSSAIRSYGFYKAYQAKADIIMTLDDDCYPTSQDSKDVFVRQHIANLCQTPKWITTVPYQFVRGLPYDLGEDGFATNVAVNMGLWYGVGDIDAVQALAGNVPENFDPHSYDRMMSPWQYFPMCGMNMAFHRNMISGMLFAPSGEEQPYDRFDDIWCGIILQRIARHLGFGFTVGQPTVNHMRASDPIANLTKEAPGIEANITLWKFIDSIDLTGETTLPDCIAKIAKSFRHHENSEVPNRLLSDYLRNYGAALQVWSMMYAEATTTAGGDGPGPATDDDASGDGEQSPTVGDQ